MRLEKFIAQHLIKVIPSEEDCRLFHPARSTIFLYLRWGKMAQGAMAAVLSHSILVCGFRVFVPVSSLINIISDDISILNLVMIDIVMQLLLKINDSS